MNNQKIEEKTAKSSAASSKSEDTPKSSKTSEKRIKTKISKSKSPSSPRPSTKECMHHNHNKTTPKSSKRKSPQSKENSTGRKERKSRIDHHVLVEKNERVKKLKDKKGFDSSTPKSESLRSRKETFTTVSNKKILEGEGWEPPRVSSIQPNTNGNLNRTGHSGGNDHTITLNCSSISADSAKKNDTVVGTQIVTVEDSINCGDLTILTQRIDDMKIESFSEGVLSNSSSAKKKQASVLSVVQKLSGYPPGKDNFFTRGKVSMPQGAKKKKN